MRTWVSLALTITPRLVFPLFISVMQSTVPPRLRPRDGNKGCVCVWEGGGWGGGESGVYSAAPRRDSPLHQASQALEDVHVADDGSRVLGPQPLPPPQLVPPPS